MRKSLAIAIAALLVLGLVGAPSALAKKKKKKKKAPATKTITFEESGTIAIPAPSSLVLGGVTEIEFTIAHGCASLPASQGVDGHVVEVPEEFRAGDATLEVLGSDATGAYDLDVYFYDAGCGLMEPYMTDGVDPSGAIPPGAAWAVVDLLVGANASFDLTGTVTIEI